MSSANILFLFIMLIGPLVTVSSSNWIICWVGIELNFLGLIPLMYMSNKYMSLTKEATLKYFCIQALSSAILFFSGMIMYLEYNLLYEVFFIFSLCLKLGLFPGHFWVPSITSSLESLPVLLMLSWQKIPAFVLLASCVSLNSQSYNTYIVVLGGVSAVVGGLIGNNMTNVRAMIGASSVSHTGWAVIASCSGYLWSYLFLYFLVLIFLMKFLWENHKGSSLSILSLSGLPPFIMFVAKWNVVSGAMLNLMDYKFLIFPIMGTILSLIFYLKFMYSYYLNSSVHSNNNAVVPLILVNLTGFLYLIL